MLIKLEQGLAMMDEVDEYGLLKDVEGGVLPLLTADNWVWYYQNQLNSNSSQITGYVIATESLIHYFEKVLKTKSNFAELKQELELFLEGRKKLEESFGSISSLDDLPEAPRPF